MSRFFFNEKLLPLANDESALIFHPHCARTAGRTFREHVLSPAFGEDRVYCRQHVIDWKSWEDLTDEDLKGFRAYTDLRNFDVIPLKRPIACIGVLRDPLYRIVSLYGFIKRNVNHRHYEQAQKYAMEEFYRVASDEHPEYFRNVQTTRICGAPDARLALDFIRQKYIAVGFTNQLTDFVHELCDLFKWRFIDLERIAPDEERYASRVTPSFREMVLNENAEDLALFEAVSQGRTLDAPGAQFFKRYIYLSGLVPALRKRQRDFLRWIRGRSKSKKITPAQKKGRRMERRAKERIEYAREVERTAPPGSVICNLCGTVQTPDGETKIKRVCPRCKSSERQRSFPEMFETALEPMFKKWKPREALLLSPGTIERKLIEPRFETVTISSLYNTYRGRFVQADVKDLAPFQDASFDYVQACNVLEYVGEMDKALASVARVLKPGGVFCMHVMDHRLTPGDEPITVTYHTDTPVKYYEKGFKIPAVRLGRETLKRLLTGAGFAFETFEIEDPMTKTVCTWWLCRKAAIEPGAAPKTATSVSE